MIDLAKLKAQAESTDGGTVEVSRAWLKQALDELRAGRDAQQLLRVMHGVSA